MEKIWKDKRLAFIMICSFAWGLAAHGPAMFHKFSFHDDVPWFNGVGETYGLGRWFLAVIGDLNELFLGSKNYSVPAFNGVLTIAGIALIIFLICRRIGIENKVIIAALCGALVCFPSVTNIFGFVFTAPQYYIGSLLAVAGAYLYYTYKNIPSFIACTVLVALSVGIYQSNIPVALMALLLFMLDEVVSSEMKWKDYFLLAAKNALVCICFMAEYFAINAIVLKARHAEMYDYKGANTFGATSPAAYLYRIYTAYKRFVKPADHINYDGVSTNMFPWNIKYFHILLIVTVIVLILYMLKAAGTKEKIMQIGVLLAVSPLFSYFIYIMVDEDDAHGGMAFAEAFMFFVAAYVIQSCLGLEEGETGRAPRIILSRIAITLMMIIAVMFTRFANVCYLKIDIMQSRAISYYNTLITRIQSVEGYTEDTPVMYAGGEKNEDEVSVEELFDPIYLPPFQGNAIINDFSWEETMKLWCGFSPVKATDEEAEAVDPAAVYAMPEYPADGSVKMVDGVVVVKF